MSGQFQYFVSPPAGKPTVAFDELPQFGLAYAFDKANQPKCCKTMTGPRPDHSGGIVLCSSTDRIGYYPDRQKWRAMHGNPDVWVGMELDHAPTPLDVARPKQADGEWLTMRDESRWLIPRARQYEMGEAGIVYSESLPASLDISPNGEWIRGDVFAEYRRLWELANEIADGGDNLDALATAAISANYRAGQTEWALLGLLDTDWQVLLSVLRIVLDRERSEELQKKTVESLTEMSVGFNGALPPTTDDQPDIDQPSLNQESGQRAAIEVSAGANS